MRAKDRVRLRSILCRPAPAGETGFNRKRAKSSHWVDNRAFGRGNGVVSEWVDTSHSSVTSRAAPEPAKHGGSPPFPAESSHLGWKSALSRPPRADVGWATPRSSLSLHDAPPAPARPGGTPPFNPESGGLLTFGWKSALSPSRGRFGMGNALQRPHRPAPPLGTPVEHGISPHPTENHKKHYHDHGWPRNGLGKPLEGARGRGRAREGQKKMQLPP